MKFYPGDYLSATRVLSPAAKGAWVDMLCAMWGPRTRGELEMRLSALGRLIGASEEEAGQLVDELDESGVAEVEWAEDRQSVRIRSRRIAKDWEEADSRHRAQVEGGRKGGSKQPRSFGEGTLEGTLEGKLEATSTPPSGKVPPESRNGGEPAHVQGDKTAHSPEESCKMQDSEASGKGTSKGTLKPTSRHPSRVPPSKSEVRSQSTRKETSTSEVRSGEVDSGLDEMRGEDPERNPDGDPGRTTPVEALRSRVLRCNASWGRPWTYEEENALTLNLGFFRSLSEEDWDLMRAWFALRERDGEQLYRVQRLSRFLSEPGAEFDKARAVRDKDRKRFAAALKPRRSAPAERPPRPILDESTPDPVPPEEAKAAIEALRRGILKGGGL